jgi:pimeloyl-ACP methyl ester carboxylesterase
MTAIKYRSADVDGLKVFYREAGRDDAPALLLLHGFPSGSHMFRDLIPAPGRSPPHHRARSTGFRPIGDAYAERVLLHIRSHRRHH